MNGKEGLTRQKKKTKSPYIKLQGMCLIKSLPLRDVGMAIAF